MGSQTVNGLPYPVGSDRVMDGDNAIQALAEAVDTKVIRTADSGNQTPQNGGFVAQAGFTGLAGLVRRRNGLVFVSLGVVTTNAIGAGNVANVNVVSIPAGWSPLAHANITGTHAGPVVNLYANAGMITLNATGEAMPAGYAFTFAGLWMV